MSEQTEQRSVLDLFKLDGRRAIVTGGGRGIGMAIAKALGEAGAQVALVSRTKEQLDAATADVPNSVAVPFDVMTAEATQLVDDCEAALGGPIDIVVHAAGFQYREPAVDFPAEQWDRLIAVHLTAPFKISQELGRRQLASARGGSHVFIGSLNNWQSVVPNIPAYAAAKSGVGGVMRALSKEWSGRGIRCNGLAPGWVHTELTESLFADPQKAKEITSRIPMGRLAEPREMASVALFLASDASSYMTGQMLVVDGGWTTS